MVVFGGIWRKVSVPFRQLPNSLFLPQAFSSTSISFYIFSAHEVKDGYSGRLTWMFSCCKASVLKLFTSTKICK